MSSINNKAAGMEEEAVYKVYATRWLVLLAAILPNIAGGMIWLTFTPVSYKTADFYGIDVQDVNWLSLVFLIASIPFGLVATWTLEKYGVRAAILICSWAMAIGNAIKIISAIPDFDDTSKQVCLFLGQTIAACGQPFTTFCATKLASVWFPDSQRALANTLVSVAQPIGLIVAGLVPPLFVDGDDQLQVLNLLITMGSPSFLAALYATIFVRSAEPPTAPSASETQDKDEYQGGIKALFKNKDYVVILICVGGGVALFSSFATLLQQILCPYGYDEDLAGFCSATLTVTGIIGALIVGIYCDKTKQFSTALKTSYFMVTVGVVVFCIVFRYKLDYYILILMGLIGIFAFGILPIGLELAAECSYPVGVATASGLIVVSGQIQSVILVLILQSIGSIIDPNEYYTSPYQQKCTANATVDTQAEEISTVYPSTSPTNTEGLSTIYDLKLSVYICAGYIGVLLLVLLAFFRPSYKRLNANKEEGSYDKSTIALSETF